MAEVAAYTALLRDRLKQAIVSVLGVRPVCIMNCIPSISYMFTGWMLRTTSRSLAGGMAKPSYSPSLWWYFPRSTGGQDRSYWKMCLQVALLSRGRLQSVGFEVDGGLPYHTLLSLPVDKLCRDLSSATVSKTW